MFIAISAEKGPTTTQSKDRMKEFSVVVEAVSDRNLAIILAIIYKIQMMM